MRGAFEPEEHNNWEQPKPQENDFSCSLIVQRRTPSKINHQRSIINHSVNDLV
jgi:hypothetical protein